ncbi:MAG: methylmalonyl-CoA mutase family protein [Bacteroidia bacterium]
MTHPKDTTLFAAFPPVSKEAWRKQIEQDLKGKPVEKLAWQVEAGVELLPFFTREDLDPDTLGLGSLPGSYPFRRGNRFHAHEPGWQIVQEVPVRGAAQGQTLMHLALEGHIAAIWLRLQTDTAPALYLLLKDFDFAHTALHLDWPAPAAELYAALADSQPELLTGTLTNDPVSAAARAGQTPTEAQWTAAFDAIAAFAASPHFRCLGLDFSYIHERGGTHAQELALALATVVEYLVKAEALGGRDLQAQVARHMAITFAVGSAFFPEIAKWRAFRILYARVLDAMGLQDPDAQSPFLLATVARRNQSLYDRHTNLLRATTAAMSAVLGGVQAIAIGAFDARNHAENAASLRLSRNIQHLLKHESYLDRVQDPAGGAYYIEQATDRLALRAWQLFQEIEAAGGFLACVASGQVGTWLAQADAAERQRLATRRSTLVGVNQYANPVETLDMTPAPDAPYAGSAFEALRLRADALRHSRGRRLQAFLLLFGEVRMRNARSQFARNLLGSGGWQIVENSHPADLEASLSEAVAARPEALVLCSADGDYAATGAALVARLRTLLPDTRLILAGKPEGYEQLGTDMAIAAGMDAVAFLSDLLSAY